MKLIDEILDKYWEGQTTLQEEQELRSYFRSDRVSPEHEVYRPMFDYQTQMGAETLDFDPFEKIGSGEFSKPKSIKQWKPFVKWAIAASIAAMFMLGSTLLLDKPDKNLGTYDDPQVAYQEARGALMMISNKMEVGRQKASHLAEIKKQAKKVKQIKKKP
jgi:hypothetical protein